MNIVIAGDFAPKFRIEDKIQNGDYTFFDKVKPIFEGADYSILNLESPITLGKYEPIVKCGPNLKCVKSTVDALKYAGVKMVTLANNHIMDFGAEGMIDTLNVCNDNGIETVGVGSNLQEASAIKYVNICNQKVAIINCCEHEFSIADDSKPGANPLNPISQFYKIREAKSKSDYVLVIVHGGHEHFQLPSPRMVQTYRFFVDAGADAVINHHQHCYSGYEIYNGKPIFYGLGNFCFDSVTDRKSLWNYGYMVRLKVEDSISFDIIPYEQCSYSADVELLTTLTDSSLAEFNDTLCKLNVIIHDDKKLKESVDRYYTDCAKSLVNIFSPTDNRYFNFLMRKIGIRTIVSKKSMVRISNYVQCESHRDKVSFMLNKL